MRITRLLVALAVLFSLLAAAPASAETDRARPGKPEAPVGENDIRWRSCFGDVGPFYECARVRVPLDHDQPRGLKISLALVRIPAADQENKIGSLFLNPGGPGGSGVDFVLGAGPVLYSDDVRAHFDLIGFDPRGINLSTPLLCFETFEDALLSFPPFAFPLGPEEEAIEKASMEYLAANCETTRRIRDHMSTSDVARDMDLMRQMVGDEKLTYAGYSYGSYLGAVYANLFPDNVRAIVVDGVLDPVAWSTGVGDQAATLPFSTRLGSSIGAQDTLDEFFRLCDASGPELCAFAPDSAARFAALADRLLEEPALIADPETGDEFPFRYSDLVGSTLGPLYNSFSWADYSLFLAFLEANISPLDIGKQLGVVLEASGLSAMRTREWYPNVVEGFPGVACADSVNPDNYEAWPIAAAADEAANGYFGRLWTHASAPCWNWPGNAQDVFMGPFTADTSNTVLVVNPLWDPATPLHGAEALDALLPNSSLLRVESWGHTSLFTSFCADSIVSEYLLTGVAPATGQVCSQDIPPFTPLDALSVQGGDVDVRTRAEARAAVMSEVAFVPAR